MTQEWGREEFIDCCNSNERTGMAWWRLGIWKLRGSRKGVEKGTCSLCLGKKIPNTFYWSVRKPKLENGNAV
jgi:hypothetical protein